jgi:hypothetical protein
MWANAGGTRVIFEEQRSRLAWASSLTSSEELMKTQNCHFDNFDVSNPYFDKTEENFP